VKKGLRTTSFAVTMVAAVLLSLVTAFVYRQMRERITLLSANENERILNMLLASLRDHDDFGVAIESSSFLSARVAGVAVYFESGESLYAWGAVPATFRAESVDHAQDFGAGEFGSVDRNRDAQSRFTIPDPKTRTQRFVIRSSRMAPPPHNKRQSSDAATVESEPPDPSGPSDAAARKNGSFFFNTLTKGEWLYIDIRHPEYWRERTLMDILFPIVGIAMILLAFYVRSLALKNADYRERIERQKNLVVLGTAASTLAHEIKNPLLAIRLQTGILGKMYPETGNEELGIINAEIERLSALTYRINDYLREPKGSPVEIVLAEFVRDCGKSVCGRDPVSLDETGGASVYIDPDRFRSALGNLLGNALESGGDPALVEVRLSRADRFLVVDVLDRGKGISPETSRNLFEPFFTTKSRGTGIGLSISRRFIEAAGGTVDLVSRDDDGALDEGGARELGGARARIRLPEGGGNA
jgi:two-component system sensor histidine kinase HydH